MKLFKNISEDWKANKGNTKGRVITLLFRIGFAVNSNRVSKIIFIPYTIFYKFFVEWLLGVEIPCNTIIGPGLLLYHGQATVVHRNTRIGANCILRQCTTIGNAMANGPSPVIGNNVEIGCNVSIIGGVIIGDNAKIGAGSVVIKHVPQNSVVIGNPARVIKQF